MDGKLTPNTHILPSPLLSPAAVDAAEKAVEAAFTTLERSNTSLPDWADFNLFGAVFGRIRKKQTRLASEMTIEEFASELAHIVADVAETAEGINNHRPEKTSSHIDVATLTQQIQAVADAALTASRDVMQQEASTERMEPSALSTHKR